MKKIVSVVCFGIAYLTFGCAQDVDSHLEGLDVLEGEVHTVQQAIRTDPDPAADGEITLAELEAMAQEMGIVLEPLRIVHEIPDSAVFAKPKSSIGSDICTTGVDQPSDPTPTTFSRGNPRGDYRMNFSMLSHRTIPPKTIRGGRVREFPSNPPEIIILQDSYRAAGCANDARVNDPPCRNHPYRRALDAELALEGPGNGNPRNP